MKLKVWIFALLILIAHSAVSACGIVQKRSVHQGVNQGVAGVCSNNGRKIECLNMGENGGGLSCSGPEGTFSGINLQELIKSACACGPDDRNELLEQQIDQELD